MELLDYARALRTHRIGVTVIVLIALLGAGTLALTQPKVYAADARGFVTAGRGSDPSLESVNDALAKSRVVSYVEIAGSRAVAELVIDDLDLDETPSSLIGRIKVEQPEQTVIIKVTAKASSPAGARLLADAWIRALAARIEQLETPDDADAAGTVSLVPVESAALPTAPIAPRPPLYLAVGLVVGLVLAVGYASALSTFDRRIRAGDDLESAFSLTTIGQVPLRPGMTASDSARLADDQGWFVGEAFRKLRTNLSYMSVDSPPRVIVVTSPRPADGKSTVASNLAATISLSGQAVTLVDGDLRRPTVASSLGLVEGAGLTDVLIGQADLDDVLQDHADLPSLSVLAAGSTPPNPSELLGSQAMQGLLRDLGSRGLVVVDAPPLLPVTDGAVLTRHSDGALVVVSHGRTIDSDLVECIRQLEAVQGKVLGVVFNRVPRKRRGRSDYYYAAQAQGSGSSGTSGRKDKNSGKRRSR